MGRAIASALVLLALAASALVGQQAPTELTLDEAIRLAKLNNPIFLSTQNDRGPAAWQRREAYASFLPTVNASGGLGWQEAGQQRFGTVVFDQQTTDWAFSSYNLSLNWNLSGQEIFGVPNARANERATGARIDAAEFDLESRVAFQYMSALRAQDQADVAQRQLDRAQQNLRIVNTRVETGASAGTEGKQAEVDLGRVEVALIQAQRDVRQGKLLLAEQLGVPLPVDVELASAFEVFEPDYELDALLSHALDAHPSLRAFVAQEAASKASARALVTSQYLPSVNVRTGWSGQSQQALNEAFLINSAQSSLAAQRSSCEFNNALNERLTSPIPGFEAGDCSSYQLTDAMRNDLLAGNEVFPFQFDKNPLQVSMTVSIPVFTGFSRERQVAQANNVADDAEQNRRAEELRLRTAVTNAYDNVVSAYQVYQAESRNRALAEEQLLLQRRRYALGAAGLLELLDAQTSATTADQAFLNAVYDFHYNLIALEAAVGRPLRTR